MSTMSVTTVSRVCDRCGKMQEWPSEKPTVEGRAFTTVQHLGASGGPVISKGHPQDLCGPCSASLREWWSAGKREEDAKL